MCRLKERTGNRAGISASRMGACQSGTVADPRLTASPLVSTHRSQGKARAAELSRLPGVQGRAD